MGVVGGTKKKKKSSSHKHSSNSSHEAAWNMKTNAIQSASRSKIFTYTFALLAHMNMCCCIWESISHPR